MTPARGETGLLLELNKIPPKPNNRDNKSWGWGKQAAQCYSVLSVINIMCWLFTSRTCAYPSPQAACTPHYAPDISPYKRHHLPANLDC
uniref:Uncharacterized protein n=1 Tax=Timema poppense TaxID=170557 RepID=A0A7R9H5Z9_TIMPO|nr:unnamed protein product [Timema poppensis]